LCLIKKRVCSLSSDGWDDPVYCAGNYAGKIYQAIFQLSSHSLLGIVTFKHHTPFERIVTPSFFGRLGKKTLFKRSDYISLQIVYSYISLILGDVTYEGEQILLLALVCFGARALLGNALVGYARDKLGSKKILFFPWWSKVFRFFLWFWYIIRFFSFTWSFLPGKSRVNVSGSDST